MMMRFDPSRTIAHRTRCRLHELTRRDCAGDVHVRFETSRVSAVPRPELFASSIEVPVPPLLLCSRPTVPTPAAQPIVPRTVQPELAGLAIPSAVGTPLLSFHRVDAGSPFPWHVPCGTSRKARGHGALCRRLLPLAACPSDIVSRDHDPLGHMRRPQLAARDGRENALTRPPQGDGRLGQRHPGVVREIGLLPACVHEGYLFGSNSAAELPPCRVMYLTRCLFGVKHFFNVVLSG